MRGWGELSQLVPIREVRDGVVFLEDGRVGVAFHLYFPPSRLRTLERHAATLERLALMMRQALPQDANLRIYIEAIEEDLNLPRSYLEFLERAKGVVHDINRAKLDALSILAARGQVRSWRTYMTILWPPYLRKTAKESFTREEYTALLQEVATLTDAVEQATIASEIDAVRMTGEEVEDILYAHYNPSLKGLRPGDGETVQERVLRSRVDNRFDDKIRVGSTWVSGVVMAKGPTRTFPGILNPLLELEGEFSLVFEFTKRDQFELSTKLNTIRVRLENVAADLGNRADPELVVRAKMLAQGLERRARTGEQILEVGAMVIVKAESLQDLHARLGKIQGQLQTLPNARPVKSPPGWFEYWMAAAPFSSNPLPRRWSYLDMNAAHMIPTRTPWRGSPKPIAWYLTREKSLVGINPFDRRATAWNGVVVGGSGSGKTFFTQSYITSFLLDGDFVAIVDKGGGYVPLVELLGGQIIYFSPGADFTINPFDLPEGEIEPSEEKKFFLLSLIKQMLPVSDGETESKQTVILLAAIERLYQSHLQEVRRPDGSVTRVLRTPTLSDFRRTLVTIQEAFSQAMTDRDREIAKNMAQSLALWTGNTPFGRLLDGQTTLDLSSPVVYFETTGIGQSPELERVGLLLLMDLLWRRIAKDPGEKKLIVFDEVWSLLASPTAARFVEDFYRRLRRYNAGALSCTQKLDDFTSGHAKGIIENSSYFFLLASTGQAPVVKRILELPDDVVQQYSTLAGKGEFLFLLKVAGQFEGDFLRYVPSGYEFAAFGTAPEEQVRRREMAKELGGLPAAVQTWHLEWLSDQLRREVGEGEGETLLANTAG